MRPSIHPSIRRARGRDRPGRRRHFRALRCAPRGPGAAVSPATQVSRQETACAPAAVHTGERGRTCRAGLAPRPLPLTGRAAAARPRPAQTAPPLPQLRAPATSGRTPPTRGHPSYGGRIPWGSFCRESEGGPRVWSLFPSRSSGPIAATSRDPLCYLRLLPSAPDLAKSPTDRLLV